MWKYKPGDKIHDYENRDNGVIVACALMDRGGRDHYAYVVRWNNEDVEQYAADFLERFVDDGHVDWETDQRYEHEPEINPER